MQSTYPRMLYGDLLLSQIIIQIPILCHVKYFCGFHTTEQNILPSTRHFRRILHHYKLFTYSNDHIKNSCYNYILFIGLIYFYITFYFVSENKDVINMHTIFLTKYKMIIRIQSNIY